MVNEVNEKGFDESMLIKLPSNHKAKHNFEKFYPKFKNINMESNKFTLMFIFYKSFSLTIALIIFIYIFENVCNAAKPHLFSKILESIDI